MGWFSSKVSLSHNVAKEETLTKPVPKGLEAVLKIDPEVMHEKLCFAGTRAPLTIFLDNQADGMGVAEFLVNYPTITQEQAYAVLAWENNALRQAAGLKLAG